MASTCLTNSTNGSPSRRRQLRSVRAFELCGSGAASASGPPYAYFGRTVDIAACALEHFRQSEITPVRTNRMK